MIKTLNKSYYNITKKRLNNSSHLWAYNILEDSENKFFNIFRSFSVREMNINYFVTHILQEEDWWDNLSYTYYGTSRLWWIIPLLNEIKNPMEAPEADTRVKILKKEYLFLFMNEIKNLSNK